MKNTFGVDVVGFAARLGDAGFYTELRLQKNKLPELTVQASVFLKPKRRVGWVRRRGCVGVVPRRNRRWRG